MAVTVLGGFLRFYQLELRGPINADEATTILHARQWLACGQLFAQKLGLLPAQNPQELLNYLTLRGWSAYDAKVGNAFIRAIGLWVFGDSVYGATLPIAILATLTIPVLFCFTQRLLGDFRVSLVAATLLALSPTAVFYGRGFKTEADSMLLLLLGLWCYYESSRRPGPLQAARWTWASGLLVGMGVSCNGRAVDLLTVILLVVAAHKFCLRRPWLTALGNCLRIAVAMGLIAVFWELPYHGAMIAARRAGVSLDSFPFYTYWQGLAMKRDIVLNAYQLTGWSPDGLQAWFYFLFGHEGPAAVLMLLGLGRASLLIKRFPMAVLLIPAVAGLVVFCAAMSHAYYLCSFSLPALCALGAVGFCWLGDRWLCNRRFWPRSITLGAIVLPILGWYGWASWEAVGLRSRMGEAMRWLKQNHPNAVVAATSYTPALCEYDNAHIGYLLPAMKREDFATFASRFQFFVVDNEKYANCLTGVLPLNYSLLPSSQAFATPYNSFERVTTPVATFTNAYSRMGFFFLTAHGNCVLARTRLFLRSNVPHEDSVIRIYDTRAVMESLYPPGSLLMLPTLTR